MIKLGEGKTATVYTDGTFAYKKYHEHYDIKNINYEVHVQNEIYNKTKLPVTSYEIVDHMIKMTLYEGPTLADRILKEGYQEGLNDFMNLQKDIYQYHDLDLHDVYTIFDKQIRNTQIDDLLKEKALKSLSSIERKFVLCHFDFHPLNIIYSNQSYAIIDWTNAKLGNPSMDIASTYIIFRQYAVELAEPYLLNITRMTGISIDDVLTAIPVMAFIKIRENEEKEQEHLLKQFVLGKDDVFHINNQKGH